MPHLPAIGFMRFALKHLLWTVARNRVYIDLKYKTSVLFQSLLVLVQFNLCAKKNTVPLPLLFSAEGWFSVLES